MNKLFVGNLSWDTNEDELRDFFQTCGVVVSVKIISDKATGKSKGFGFVEMENADGATAAIAKLNDQPVRGRNIRVSLAQERPERPRGERSEGGFRGSSDRGSSDRGDRNDRGGERRERRGGGGGSGYSGGKSYSGFSSR